MVNLSMGRIQLIFHSVGSYIKRLRVMKQMILVLCVSIVSTNALLSQEENQPPVVAPLPVIPLEESPPETKAPMPPGGRISPPDAEPKRSPPSPAQPPSVPFIPEPEKGLENGKTLMLGEPYRLRWNNTQSIFVLPFDGEFTAEDGMELCKTLEDADIVWRGAVGLKFGKKISQIEKSWTVDSKNGVITVNITYYFGQIPRKAPPAEEKKHKKEDGKPASEDLNKTA